MPDIDERLEEVRRREHLSRRAFAKTLEEKTGYAVSHSSVGQYEAGTTVPAAYAAAVSTAFNVNPRWLILGEGMRADAAPSRMEAALARIQEVLEELDGEIEV